MKSKIEKDQKNFTMQNFNSQYSLYCDKKNVLFAYGSLVSEDEIKRLVGGQRMVIPAKLQGFRREACVRSDDEEYGMFGAIKDKNSFINGALLFLDDDDFSYLDKGEYLYHKETVSIEDIVFYNPGDSELINVLKNIPINMYIPNQNTIHENTELFPEYKKLVEKSFMLVGRVFYLDFIKTTKI